MVSPSVHAYAAQDQEIEEEIQDIFSSDEFTSEKSESFIDKVAAMLESFFAWLMGGEKEPVPSRSEKKKETTSPMEQGKSSERNASTSNRQYTQKSSAGSAGENRQEQSGYTLGGGGSTVLHSVFQVIGVTIIVVIILAVLFYALRNVRFKGKIKSSRPKDEEFDITEASVRNLDEVEARALEYYEKGDFRQAFRYLYIALLSYLNRRNIIRIDSSKTNRQYVNEVREFGYQGEEMFSGFTSEFNVCWYGKRELYKERFDYWYDQYTGLIKGGNR